MAEQPPRPLNPVLRIFLVTLVLIIFVPLFVIIGSIYVILCLPYAAIFRPPHVYGIRKNDCPPVEVYLHHFEQLYPDLIQFVSAAHTRRKNQTAASATKFWPQKHTNTIIPLIAVTIVETQYTFSQGAGFFATLQSAGWDKRMLWTFLQSTVEQAGLVTEEQKAAYAKVMEKMVSGKMFKGLEIILGFLSNKVFKRLQVDDTPKLDEVAEHFTQSGRPVVRVRDDSLDWILQRGVILVPEGKTKVKMQRLCHFPPVWQEITMDSQVDTSLAGNWQIVCPKITTKETV